MIQKPDTPLGVLMLKYIEKYKETLACEHDSKRFKITS